MSLIETSPGETGLTWVGEEVVVTIGASGATASATPPRLAWTIDVTPGAELTLRWGVRCREHRPVVVSPRARIEWARPEVEADEPRLARLLAQSLDDAAALRLAEPNDPDSTFIAAGVPWFLTLFGRDSLWVARMMLPLGTKLAEGTLRVLARRQGTRTDPISGEQPGKIMHELRRSDVGSARAGVGPAALLGTVDATLLWISLLARRVAMGGCPRPAVATFLPHLRPRAGPGWREHGDPNGDGFIEYLDLSGRGLANQGWKDRKRRSAFMTVRWPNHRSRCARCRGTRTGAAMDAADLLDVLRRRGSPTRGGTGGAATPPGCRTVSASDSGCSGPLGPHPALALDRAGRPVDSLTSKSATCSAPGFSPNRRRSGWRICWGPTRCPVPMASGRCPQ